MISDFIDMITFVAMAGMVLMFFFTLLCGFAYVMLSAIEWLVPR